MVSHFRMLCCCYRASHDLGQTRQRRPLPGQRDCMPEDIKELDYKEMTTTFENSSRIVPYTVYVCMRESISENQR